MKDQIRFWIFKSRKQTFSSKIKITTYAWICKNNSEKNSVINKNSNQSDNLLKNSDKFCDLLENSNKSWNEINSRIY